MREVEEEKRRDRATGRRNRGLRGGKVIGRVARGKGGRLKTEGTKERAPWARERGTDTRIQIRRVGGRCGKSAVLRGRSSRQRDRGRKREKERERGRE